MCPPIGDISIIDRFRERYDINFNALPGYLRADDPFDSDDTETHDIEGTGVGGGSPPSDGTEGPHDAGGSYIVNDETSIADASAALEDDIAEEEFRLSHGGLTREEWNQLMQLLRDMGYGFIADAMEAHPEAAATLLDMLSDPETYWAELKAQAKAEWEAAGKTGDSVETRMMKLHRELMQQCGLPESFDLKGISSSLKTLANQWKERLWIHQDGDYLYLDPAFFEYMEKIMGLYNSLMLIYMLAAFRQDWKDGLSEIIEQIQKEKPKTSLTEMADTRRQNASLHLRYELYVLQRYVYSHNTRVYQQKLQKAREQAHDEATSGWSSTWNWIAKVITSGASQTMEKDEERRFYEKSVGINREYQNFLSRVEQMYEQVLGHDINLNTGDPFGGGIDLAMDSVDFSAFSLNVGGGKWDMNRTLATDSHKEFTALENTRRMFYSVHLAKKKLKEGLTAVIIGREAGNDTTTLVQSAVDNASKFEQLLFGNIVTQMQTYMGIHNAQVDAQYYADKYYDEYCLSIVSDFFLFGATLTYYLFDWAIELKYYLQNDYESNFEISNINVNQLMDGLNTSRTDTARAILNSNEAAAQYLNDLENRQWTVIEGLEGSDCVMTGDDDLQVMNEARINQMRENLVSMQNVARLITTVSLTKAKVVELLGKVIRGKGVEGVEAINVDSLDAVHQTRLMAFEMKKANLINRIQESNKEAAEYRNVVQSAYKAVGAAIGIVIAVLLCVFGGPIGVLGAVGLCVGLGQLFMNLANIIFLAVNPVDDDNFNNDLFYGTSQRRMTGNMAADLYNDLENNQEQRVDSLNENSVIDIGGPTFAEDQWAVDTSAVMEINTALLKYQIIQKIVLMIVQAKKDIQNIVLATTTGVSGSDHSEYLQATNGAAYKSKVAALELRREMVADIVGGHNRAELADAEMYRSIINSAISLVSAICSAAGTAVGDILGVVFNLVNAIVNMGISINDYLSKNELSKQAAIQEAIDDIYRVNRQSMTATMQEAELAAVNQAGNNLVVDVGGGNIAVDTAAFARLGQQIEEIYTSQLLLANVAQSKSRMAQSVARAVGMPSVAPDQSAMEAFYEAKDTSQKNLDLLKARVSDYVDRQNQVNEAVRGLVMACISTVMSIIKAALKLSHNEDALGDSINQAFEDALRDNGIAPSDLTASITDSEAAISILGGDGSNWDGKIGVADIIGMAAELILDQNFIELIANEIFNSTAKPDAPRQSHQVKAGKSTVSANELDHYNSKADAEEVTTGEIEIAEAQFGVQEQLKQIFWQYMWGLIKDLKNSIGKARSSGQPVTDPGNTDLTAPQSNSEPEIVPQPVNPEYTRRHDELIAGTQFGSPEAVLQLVKDLVQLNRSELTSQDQLQASYVLDARDIGSRVGADHPEVLAALTDYAVSDEATPQETAMIMGILASSGSPQAGEMLQRIANDVMLKYVNGEMTAEEVDQIFNVITNFSAARTAMAPAAAAAGTAMVAPEEGSSQPISAIDQTLFELEFFAAQAKEQSEQNPQPDLGLVRSHMKALATLLPRTALPAEVQQQLQDAQQNALNYDAEKLLTTLQTVRANAEALGLSEEAKGWLDSAIASLGAVQANAASQTFASSFLQKVRANDSATAADLAVEFQQASPEDRIAALSRLEQNLAILEADLPPALQQRLTAFLTMISTGTYANHHPAEAEIAQRMLLQLTPSTTTAVNPETAALIEPAPPTVATPLPEGQSEAERVSVTVNLDVAPAAVAGEAAVASAGVILDEDDEVEDEEEGVEVSGGTLVARGDEEYSSAAMDLTHSLIDQHSNEDALI